MIIKREISNKTDFPEGFYPGTIERIEINRTLSLEGVLTPSKL
jgi:hypothetical protein